MIDLRHVLAFLPYRRNSKIETHIEIGSVPDRNTIVYQNVSKYLHKYVCRTSKDETNSDKEKIGDSLSDYRVLSTLKRELFLLIWQIVEILPLQHQQILDIQFAVHKNMTHKHFARKIPLWIPLILKSLLIQNKEYKYIGWPSQDKENRKGPKLNFLFVDVNSGTLTQESEVGRRESQKYSFHDRSGDGRIRLIWEVFLLDRTGHPLPARLKSGQEIRTVKFHGNISENRS